MTIETVENIAATIEQFTHKANTDLAELKAKNLELERKLYDLCNGDTSGLQGVETKTAGQLIVKNAEFQALVERGSKGARATITVPTQSLLTKNTIVGDGANTRVLAPHDRMGYVSAAERRVWLRSQILTSPTAAASVEFVRETFASQAGTQHEASPAKFEGALKNESAMTFDLQTRTVLTIAHSLKASRQALSDAPALAGFINDRLRYFLEIELERQIIEGNGTTELTGMLTTSNHVDLTGVQSGDTLIDKVHRAITQLADTDYTASALVLSPAAWQEVALYTGDDGQYLHGAPATGGPRTLWGIPAFVTPAMPDESFIVADMLMAGELKMRQDAVIEVGYVNDDFTRNLVTVLGELRAAMCVTRPAAVVVGSV